MKRLLLICAICSGIAVRGQSPLGYEELLGNTKEIKIADSLFLDPGTDEAAPVDSNTIKKWFAPVLSSGANKFKNKNYSILGKITANENFDLLVLQEEKMKDDTVTIR